VRTPTPVQRGRARRGSRGSSPCVVGSRAEGRPYGSCCCGCGWYLRLVPGTSAVVSLRTTRASWSGSTSTVRIRTDGSTSRTTGLWCQGRTYAIPALGLTPGPSPDGRRWAPLRRRRPGPRGPAENRQSVSRALSEAPSGVFPFIARGLSPGWACGARHRFRRGTAVRKPRFPSRLCPIDALCPAARPPGHQWPGYEGYAPRGKDP